MATKYFTDAPEVQRIAGEVIKEEGLNLRGATVTYLAVNPYISKTIVAKCIKTAKELEYYSKCDYLIEVSAEVWQQLTDEDKYRIVHHELLHIDPEWDEKTDATNFTLRKHDLQDFKEIVNKYGTDWDSAVKVNLMTLYDVDPAEPVGV